MSFTLTFGMAPWLLSSSRRLTINLYRQGDSAAAAQTERCQPAPTTAPTQFIEQRRQHTRAAGANGMTECHRAAVDVDAVPVPIQLFTVCQHLRGKGFVDLDQIEIADREARAVQQAMD